MSLAVVILAGGEGLRIGGRKPLRRLGGEKLIDRAVRTARGWADTIAVAVRSGDQVGAVDVPVIEDDPTVEGPLGGLAAALRFARDSGAGTLLTVPCDMPFVPSDLAFRLRAAIGDTGAAVAASGARLHPVCALWRPAALQKLPAYLASGRRSLRGFAETVGHVVVDWSTNPDPFFNVNSEADLKAAEQRFRG